MILSQEKFSSANNHCVAAMITSSNHQAWEGDIEITNLGPTGLQKESIIRLKLFTLDLRFNLRIIGSLAQQDQDAFLEKFTDLLL